MKNEKIIKICEQKFIYLNYSKITQDNYMSHIKRFIESIGEKQIIHCFVKINKVWKYYYLPYPLINQH